MSHLTSTVKFFKNWSSSCEILKHSQSSQDTVSALQGLALVPLWCLDGLKRNVSKIHIRKLSSHL